MKTVPLASIIVGDDRQRKTFDADSLSELRDSILSHGLMHPITVRSEEDLTLVAGERRLRAMKMLINQSKEFKHNGQPIPVGEIPFLVYGDASDVQYEEAELLENVQREDLPWQEKAQAVARLHELRLAAATFFSFLADAFFVATSRVARYALRACFNSS